MTEAILTSAGLAALQVAHLIGREFILSQEIPAMQVLSNDGEGTSLSPASKLPRGAQVVTCAEGFDTHTVKVRCGGLYYFVFRADLVEEYGIAVTA